MGTLVHLHDPFDPTNRSVHRLARPVTVRRLVQKHKALRRHTQVYRPGGVYGNRRVREFSRSTFALLNGAPLARKQWKRATVGPDDVLVFAACPQPKGGGGSRMVLMAVIIVAAAVATWWAGGAGGAAAAAALGVSQGVIIGGTALAVAAVGYGLMALFAPPPPPTAAGQTGFAGATPSSSPTYSIGAQGNYARLEQPIPEILGRHRVFPDFVTTPYVTYLDNDQYLHHILGVGIGEYEFDETSIKLGDTPITSYASIEWAKIEPGALSDTDIADERWLTNTDLADVELPDADEGSDWEGPYATGAGALVDRIEVDFAAPRGLWAFNTGSGGLDGAGKTVDYDIRAQLIDDLGIPTGDPDTWEDLGSFSKSGTKQDALRWSEAIVLPEAGRWQIECRRTDTKDTSINAGHELHLIGLRARLIVRRTFADMTCIALKMKATGDLNSAQSRAFNLVVTRKLPTWDGVSAMTDDAPVATTNPCDAFAHIARSSNGARLTDDQIDLEGLYALYDSFDEQGWQFNFVFDQAVTLNEALSRVGRAVVAQQVTQGGKLRLVRDVAVTAPVAMFGPRNVAPGSLDIQYAMPDSTAADAVVGSYIDDRIWKPADITAAFDDSAQERPARVTLHGVTVRSQAWANVWWLARQNRYRRRTVSFSAPMEGLAVLFGDGVSFSHDVPKWGQTLEVIDLDDSDPEAPILTLADPPDFSAGGTHYAAVRDGTARLAGPFVATAASGQPDQLVLTVPDPDDLPEILIGGDRERTWLQFGPGEAYAKPLKVMRVTPRDETTAAIVACDDDPRMYDELPDEPDVPIGTPTDPIVVPIPDGSTNVDLRALANENGFVGVSTQQVTFTIALGDVVFNLKRGSWPAGYQIVIENNGTISGTDGAAGTAGQGGTPDPGTPDPGNGTAGGKGGGGGTALDSRTGKTALTNNGTIRGGKGAGGGGGGGGGAYYESGGVGHQLTGGAGGAGNGGSGVAGASDATATAGTGGNGGAQGGYGAAGSPGTAGTAATGGSINGSGGAAGLGGAAGRAILGIAKVTLTGSGTITGATS